MCMNGKGFAVRFLASSLAVVCVAYAAVLFRWTYQACSDAAYNVDRFNQQEALAWVVGVNVLALLFVFTRAAWLPVALGLLGLVAFAVAGPMLVFMAISECGVAGWDLSPFFVAFLGGSMLMVAAAVSLVVKAVKHLAVHALGRPGVILGGAHFEIGDLLAALAFVATAVAAPLIFQMNGYGQRANPDDNMPPPGVMHCRDNQWLEIDLIGQGGRDLRSSNGRGLWSVCWLWASPNHSQLAPAGLRRREYANHRGNGCANPAK